MPDGVINAIGSFATATGFLFHLGYGKDPKRTLYNTPRAICSAHGSCMLIRSDVVHAIGLFDAIFFAYFEETDFCLRTQIAGHTVMYEPASTIYHKGGVTAARFGSTTLLFHSYKNRIFSYATTLELRTLLRLLPVHGFLCILASFIYIVLGRFGQALAVQRALWWNIRHMHRIRTRRKNIRETRTVSDQSFLPRVTWRPRISYYYYLFVGLEQYVD